MPFVFSPNSLSRKIDEIREFTRGTQVWSSEYHRHPYLLPSPMDHKGRYVTISGDRFWVSLSLSFWEIFGAFFYEEHILGLRKQPVFQKARTEIPSLVAEVLLSFMASLCSPVHAEN
jgi:hypothetical protein